MDKREHELRSKFLNIFNKTELTENINSDLVEKYDTMINFSKFSYKKNGPCYKSESGFVFEMPAGIVIGFVFKLKYIQDHEPLLELFEVRINSGSGDLYTWAKSCCLDYGVELNVIDDVWLSMESNDSGVVYGLL